MDIDRSSSISVVATGAECRTVPGQGFGRELYSITWRVLRIFAAPTQRLGACATALIFFSMAGCSNDAPSSARDPQTLVRIAEDEAKGLDPQSYSDLASMRIAAEQFEGLTRFAANGTAEPGLAERWSASPDGLSWTFTLRRGLRFADGVAIDANSFVAIFKRLHDEATASPHKGLFEAIKALDAPDPLHLVVRLSHPFPALPDLLAHPAMAALPLHRKDWTADRPIMASGAYRVSEWELNDHVRFTINPAWHEGKPAISSVEWRPLSDGLVALRLFNSGGADVLGDVLSSRLPELRKTKNRALHVAPLSGSYYFAFNTRRPPFNDKRVRMALSLSVEREWLAGKMLASGVAPAWGVVPPGTTGLPAYQPDWATWPRAQRLQEATKLLSAAGYSPTNPLRFEIRFNSDTDHRRVAVSLAAMWRPLGVDAKLLNSEASLHFASLRRADFSLARSGWIGDIAVPENYLSVHDSASGPINYSGFANKSFEATLQAALAEPSAARRAADMRKAEDILMAETPILPLYYYVSKVMVAPRVSGWVDNAANVHPSRTLALK